MTSLLILPRTDPLIRRLSFVFTGQTIGCVLTLLVIAVRPRWRFGTFALSQAVAVAIARKRFPVGTAPASRTAAGDLA